MQGPEPSKALGTPAVGLFSSPSDPQTSSSVNLFSTPSDPKTSGSVDLFNGTQTSVLIPGNLFVDPPKASSGSSNPFLTGKLQSELNPDSYDDAYDDAYGGESTNEPHSDKGEQLNNSNSEKPSDSKTGEQSAVPLVDDDEKPTISPPSYEEAVHESSSTYEKALVADGSGVVVEDDGSDHDDDDAPASRREMFSAIVEDLARAREAGDDRTLFELELDAVDMIEDDTSEEAMSDLVSVLIERSLEDTSFTEVACDLCRSLWVKEHMFGALLKPLLSLLQSNFKKRQELREESTSSYYSLLILLCACHKRLQTAAEKLKCMLGSAICTMFNELLAAQPDDKDSPNEDINPFFIQFQFIGPSLLLLQKEKLDTVVNTIRMKVISGQCTRGERLILVQALELYASGFNLPDEISAAYQGLALVD